MGTTDLSPARCPLRALAGWVLNIQSTSSMGFHGAVSTALRWALSTSVPGSDCSVMGSWSPSLTSTSVELNTEKGRGVRQLS